MRAEFYKLDEPDLVIGSAEWDGHRAVITAFGDEAKTTLARMFRVSLVAIDDPSMLPPGTHGPAVVEPGDLEWFRAAALVRGAAEGYGVRFARTSPEAGTRRWIRRPTAGPARSRRCRASVERPDPPGGFRRLRRGVR